MYNRYIPQPDGSYRRSRMQDGAPPQYQTPQQQAYPSEPPSPEHCSPACPHRQTKPVSHVRSQRMNPPPQHTPSESPRGISIGSFLKRLLPGDFDTSDLLVVLLLLLMAGDCQEDQNSALLTLVLYLFL